MKMCSDKNCQINKRLLKSKVYADKKSQAHKNCQTSVMRPKKPKSHMWSVTKKTDGQLSKPAIRRLCNEKNCQSTRCYKKY